MQNFSNIIFRNSCATRNAINLHVSAYADHFMMKENCMQFNTICFFLYVHRISRHRKYLHMNGERRLSVFQGFNNPVDGCISNVNVLIVLMSQHMSVMTVKRRVSVFPQTASIGFKDFNYQKLAQLTCGR